MKNKLIKIIIGIFILSNIANASEEEILNASNIMNLMLKEMNNDAQKDLLKNAKAVLIVPASYRVGFLISGSGGSGLMSVRNGNSWSFPFFITISGGRIGLQAGVEKTTILMIFSTNESIDKVLNGKLTLGVDAAITAGPIGSNAKKNYDYADIYTYSYSKGLFARLALGGESIKIDDKKTETTYGAKIDANSIINNTATPPSSYAVTNFLNSLKYFE